MTHPHQDTLVLTFTEGISLRTWRDTGMLTREWALYRQLLPHYASLILVTYGGADDAGILHAILTPDEAAKVSVISNDHHLPLAAYAQAIPGRVVQKAALTGDVVVKTNQMPGGEVAAAIVSALRARGAHVGFIARGGYPWSQFVEYEKGKDSPQAKGAFERERALCAAADLVVGTSQEMLADLCQRHSMDASRTRLIPNYVEIEREPSPVQSREPGTLLYAGQLVARKRVDVLIEALALLPTDLHGTTRLEVVGDGEERVKLETLAKGLGVPVTFSRRVPHADLMGRMHRCTAYVQASELEGHPKTVIEAMTTGAPVIVATARGLEVVEHEVTGLKAKPHPRAFAAAMEELLRSPAKRSRLGVAAAQTARRAYGLATITLKELEAHRDALAAAGEGPVMTGHVSLAR